MKKTFLRFAAVACALSLIFLFSGCKDGDDTPTQLTRAELFNQTAQKTVLINAAGLAGSGIIVKSENSTVDIVTNYHVIENAFEADAAVKVKFYNTDDFIDTAVVGFVKSCDVAVLRVTYPEEVGVFDLSAPAAENVGESILAVGYNNGQIGAYDGIISTLSKRIFNKQLNQYMFSTQTTAPFAEGCSGGAVIDSSGNFIGLSSYTLLSNYEGQSLHTGLSYAIPKAMVFAAYTRIAASDILPARPLAGFFVNPDYSVTVNFGSYLFDVTEGSFCLVASNSKSGSVLDGSIIAKINGIELNAADKMIIFLSEIMRTYNQTWFTLS